MKILVLSLLRLGDIIQQVPLIKGIKEKYPHAEIHLLLNKQFNSVEKILDGIVHKYIYFDREAIQKGLGETQYNILWSYTQVENLINELNSNSYDMALNFTHNKLSAYLLGTLNVKDKRGLYQEEGRFQGLENRWLKYFNERFSGTQPSLFHYVEILGKSFDIPVPMPAVNVRKKSKLILFQCLTSNGKKNWPLQKFFELKKAVETALVDYEVCILGAPFEKENLLSVFSEKDLLICDLTEARKHLQNADLLVTGDTSIKHLAAQTGTLIVEIAIGSSDPTKTSAYSSLTTIVKTSVPCAPCLHSQDCSQISHLCADDVSVNDVFTAVWDQLSHEKQKQKDLSHELDRAVWELYLNNGANGVGSFYLTASQSFSKNVPAEVLKTSMTEWLLQTQVYRKWLVKAANTLPSREILSTKKNFHSSDIAELILCAQEIMKSKKDTAGYFQGLIDSLLMRFTYPGQLHERVTKAINETEELLNIRENFIYHLQTTSTEGVYYAKGIGQLSIRGFEETRESISRNLKDSEL